MDFLALLQQYMSVEAVLIAIGLTQLIKFILPQDPTKGKWSVAPVLNRFIPFLPLAIAILIVIMKDRIICDGTTPLAWDDTIIKGMISGFSASYLYRTTQVMVFGK
jgi:hypothetical protein